MGAVNSRAQATAKQDDALVRAVSLKALSWH
mgnify:FL=1